MAEACYVTVRVRPRWWLWWSPRAWRAARTSEALLNHVIKKQMLKALAATAIEGRGAMRVEWKRES